MQTPVIHITGQLIVPSGEGRVALAPGHIAVRGERVVHIETGRILPKPDFGGEDCIISPGFVDTHLHLPQFDSIGIDGLELLDWLERAIFPAELKWNDVDYARAMAGRVGRELLSFGTTAIGAYATSNHLSAQAAIDTLAGMGFAGHVGQVLMDQNGPPDLLIPAPAALSQASTLRAAGRVRPAVTPRFAVSCSKQMMRGAGVLAQKTNWYIQTHLAETVRECESVASMYGEKSYTHVYDQAGLLTPRTLLGHGIHLSDAERVLLRERGSVIAHCPTANRFLDAGTMQLNAHRRAGVGVCLGTDVGAGPDRGMMRVARAMIDAAKQAGNAGAGAGGLGGANADIPSAAECWWQITAGNAAALGLEGCGQFTTGGWADVLVIRPTTNWRASPDPLATLMYSWDDRWLECCMASGKMGWSNQP